MWLLALLACSQPPAPTPDPEDPPAQVVAEPPPLPAPTEPRYAATHVLIAYAGAVGAPEGQPRTPELARALAERIRREALGGRPLEELAREHSDGPSAGRGGSLGVYLTGTMVPEFEAAVASLPVGAVGPVVQTPFGYHVIRRDPVIEARAAHLLVSWEAALRGTPGRSQEQARARIDEAADRLAAGEPWDAVVARYSDDTTAAQGGELGLIAPGQMVPAFEDALFALQPGARSQVVETPYGYHLILREN
ncbi:MAG: peptidylprolyl isomerase [Deltaproteobacteria bacterium]|nr:peptidylprolyl isomerase [Deltaproteobacteria bacterium]